MKQHQQTFFKKTSKPFPKPTARKAPKRVAPRNIQSISMDCWNVKFD